jgi:predicted nucleic acid-binding protein
VSVGNRDRVFPDTATLYPISVADLLLRTAELGIIELLWSDYLLSEVVRVLTEYKGLPQTTAEYFCDCIRQTFPGGKVKQSSYAHLLSTRTGPDPDDHEHSAAASAANATVLLSADRTGFPLRDTLPARRRHPDAFFTELFDRHPVELLTVMREMGNARRQRESLEQTINALRRAGLQKFSVVATRLATN